MRTWLSGVSKLELAQTLLRRGIFAIDVATPEECEVLGVSLYFSIGGRVAR